MTDSAPSPEATPPPVPARPMPRLRKSVHWGAHIIEGELPAVAQPYQPPAREKRPSGWPKTGNVGATAQLGDDEEPVSIPARPYASSTVEKVADPAETPSLGEAGSSLGVPRRLDGDGMPVHEPMCDSCADSGHVCENHPDRPWAGVSDDINACDCGGAGMPCPDCCDPVLQDGAASIGDAFTPRKFLQIAWPPKPLAPPLVSPGDAAVLRSVGAPTDSIEVSPPLPTAPPAAELRALADDLNAHGGIDETFVAALLRQVVDDDAPSVLNAESVLKLRGDPTEEKVEQLRSAALRNLDAGPRPMRVVGDGPPFRGYLTAATQAEHQHIWTMTSPVRCVECRRYLRPWWRRALDRARRWGR